MRLRFPTTFWPRLLLISFTVLVVAGASTAIYLVTRPPLIPASVKQQLNFQLYYPLGLPKGLTVDPASFKVPTTNVMIFVIKDGAIKINVSEQAVPPATQLNIESFYQQLVGAVAFSTPQGAAEVGSLKSGDGLASLVAGQTWVIVTASDTVQQSQLRSVISAMFPYSS